MSIRIVYEKRHHEGKPDLSRPVFFCDHCDLPIEDAQMGLYVFPEATEGTGYYEGMPVPVYTVHKGACDRGLHESIGHDPTLSPTMEIAALPAFLARNLGLDMEESERAAGIGEES